MTGDEVLLAVESHLRAALGADSGRAGVSFVGVERLEVLRFGPDRAGLVRYATLGMSRRPMTDPAADVVAEDGPRAELMLSLRGGRDSVLRPLAVLAATPAVEGLVVRPGHSFELGAPLWEGARFTAALVLDPADPLTPAGAPSDGQPARRPDRPLGAVPELLLTGVEPVRFLPVVPITAAEQAHKRVHGPAVLARLWVEQGVDLADPDRPAVRIEGPR
jgi:hypothetical protein